MSKRNLALLGLGLALAASTARGADYGPLMDVVRATWPEKTRLSVVADYSRSAEDIRNLAEAAGEGYTIVVLDVAAPSVDIPAKVARQIKPDCVVLLRDDPLYREGCLNATWLVWRLAATGIPAIGTSPLAIQQGAVFAVSGETGNQILVSPELKGTIHVVMPSREPLRVSAFGHGQARILLASR